MVIPLPGVGIQGVPTEYALKSRSLFWGFAFMMFVSAIVKFITLNIIGGFMMLILGAVGFYALRDNSMDMGCVMTWGRKMIRVLRRDNSMDMGFVRTWGKKINGLRQFHGHGLCQDAG